MLIKLEYLVKKYDLKIKGVLAIGAHYLEEYEDYAKAGIKNIIAFEPCKDAYSVLLKKFGHGYAENVDLVNCGLGEEDGVFDMYVSKNNQGQSNSILKPKVHLSQHPDIVFDSTEKVIIRKLDNVVFDRTKFNMINADVQGNEGFVFKGAKETLKHIDIVYTEVNRAEVYENCIQVEELDEILSDFKRVETKWCGSWGDSLYLSKSILNK